MFVQSTARHRFYNETLVSFLVLAIVVATIGYGEWLESRGIAIRRWHWNNLLVVLPIIPLLFLQQRATLPPLKRLEQKRMLGYQQRLSG
jgi:predicted ABC-type exoprotein transport system permease subunit